MSNKALCILLLLSLSLFTTSALTQKKYKPWMEWSKKDAEKILNDSPWGQTLTETDTSEMFFRPQAAPSATARNTDAAGDDRGGAINQATSVNYRIRFLSAKPIRQAVARLIELDQPTPSTAVNTYMRDFVERRFNDWIAVAVTFESRDQRYSAPLLQAFNSAVTEVLRNNTYLERKDGKRLFLHTYQAPSEDGLGAKFIFLRKVDDQPFLQSDSGEVRFVSEVSKHIKLGRRFKVAEMIYDGQLEY